MAELKTKATKVSVESFLNTIKDEQKRKDCFAIVEMIEGITKEKGKMWGPAIIGFVDVHMKYQSGRELDWFKIGFSPRKANITLYFGSHESQNPLLEKLGKHKKEGGCIYINKLADVDTKVLKEIIKNTIKYFNPNP